VGPITGPLRANVETVVKNLLDSGEVPVVLISHVPAGEHPTVTIHPGISAEAARTLLEAAWKKLDDGAVPDSQIVSDPEV
jgi:hypothetical protein